MGKPWQLDREMLAGHLNRMGAAMQAGSSAQHIMAQAATRLLEDADLAERLRVAEAERDAAQARVAELEAQVARLQPIADLVDGGVRPDVSLRESMAALMHMVWAGWATWQMDHDSEASRERWRRQVATPYRELSEREQDSDRAECDKVIACLRGFIDLQTLEAGRDLRCLEECGMAWERIDDEAGVTWQVQAYDYPEFNEAGWAHFKTLPEMASAVREWQAGQKKALPYAALAGRPGEMHARRAAAEMIADAGEEARQALGRIDQTATEKLMGGAEATEPGAPEGAEGSG